MCISSYDSSSDLMPVFCFFILSIFAISTRHTNYDAVGIGNMSLHPFLF